MVTNTTRFDWPQLVVSVFLAATLRAALPVASALFLGPTVGEMLLSAYSITLTPATVSAFGSVAAFLMVLYLQEAVSVFDLV